jgi:hypothetical protein
MASRQILLLEDEVVFTHRGGMFYADTGVDGSPLYAFNPHRYLVIMEAMHRNYDDFCRRAGCEILDWPPGEH